jgi:hypothetical protein
LSCCTIGGFSRRAQLHEWIVENGVFEASRRAGGILLGVHSITHLVMLIWTKLTLSWKPDSRSASEINLCILWNPKFHFHFHESHYLFWPFKCTQCTISYPICKRLIVKNNILWDITSCSLVLVNLRLLGTRCLHHQDRKLSRISKQQASGRTWQKSDALIQTYFVSINVGFLNTIPLFCNDFYPPEKYMSFQSFVRVKYMCLPPTH